MPLDQHGTGLGQQNGVEVLCQRGLAAAVRAQHGDELAAADVQAHAVHSVLGLLGVVAEADVLYFDHRFLIRHGLFLPDGRCAAGHHAAVAETGRPISSQWVWPPFDGAKRRFDDGFHDRRAQTLGVGVDGEEQRVVAQHLLSQRDEVVDVVLELPDLRRPGRGHSSAGP